MTEFAADLLRDSGSDAHGSDSPRLRDANLAKLGVADLMQVLWHLCRLSRACLGHDDQNLVVSDGGEQLISVRIHRQALSLMTNLDPLFLLWCQFALRLFNCLFRYGLIRGLRGGRGP